MSEKDYDKLVQDVEKRMSELEKASPHLLDDEAILLFDALEKLEAFVKLRSGYPSDNLSYHITGALAKIYFVLGTWSGFEDNEEGDEPIEMDEDD